VGDNWVSGFLDIRDPAMNADRNPPPRPEPADGPDLPGPTESYHRPPGEGVGTRIGPYKLLQQIGEGGFGVVYMAEQDQPVHRRAALKVIKPGMDSAQVVARFEAERQALALMDHQNIAKVYDAGTTDSGRPFFVMELVHGVPITRYCDDNHLTVCERLALFMPVCRAVQHAHQKGIIHRDLKPSNVLVCLYDGEPVPKVIDFGVAKAIDSTSTRLTERTMFTQYGQIIGTLEYMSPEQAEMSQLGVDTRSDIYSLGVVLYELLTGSTPLARQRLRQASLSEVLRMIKEEEPPKPSTRLSGTREAARIAAARRTEPTKLGKLLRGELDWVVMKSLEKDRARRYDTAAALARDLERYLHDEPVEAGPPGAAYRLRKLARKHRTALGVAATFVLLLALGACVSTALAVRATRAEATAVAERDRAEQETARAEAGFRMARDTVDRFFTQVGDSAQLKAHGMEKFRKGLLQNAKEFYERFIREQLDAPEVRRDLGLAHVRLAKIQRALGDHAAARDLSEKAIQILDELERAHGEVAEYQSDLAAGHSELGALYFDTGRFDQAEAAYQHALAILERLAADHPEAAEYRRALATALDGSGSLYIRAGRFEKAQVSLEKGLAIWKQLAGNNSHVPEDRHGLAGVQLRLGATYGRRARPEKSESLLREALLTCQALVAEYADVPEYRYSLGLTYSALGGHYYNNMRQAGKAEAAHQQALQIYEELAREHPDVWEYTYELGRCRHNLASDAQLAGRSDVALANGEKAIEILEQLVGRGHELAQSDVFDIRLFRAGVLAGRGDHARATEEANAVARHERLGHVIHYNIACVFALSSAGAEHDGNFTPADRARLKTQYADRAMEFLHQAVAKGFENAPALKSDPDLAALRSREEFQKLVQEVEQKAKK
jgi:serine/threonine protein kinase/tetratricopeptide (TPR) repeat protein